MIVRDVMCLRYSRYHPYTYAHIFYINLIFLKVSLSSRVAFSGAIFINDIFIWAIEKKYNFLKNFIFIYRYKNAIPILFMYIVFNVSILYFIFHNCTNGIKMDNIKMCQNNTLRIYVCVWLGNNFGSNFITYIFIFII